MSYVLTNGKNYLGVSVTGQLTAVSNIEYATQFAKLEKAENAIKNLAKPLKNLGYHIEEYNGLKQTTKYVQKAVEYKEDELSEENRFITEESLSSITEALEILHNFEDWFLPLYNNKSYFEAQLEVYEKQQRDIEHAIEFYNLNACEGYKMYKLLKETRVNRRKAKDILEIIQRVSECLQSTFFEHNPSARVEALLKRKYSPRELNELFQK